MPVGDSERDLLLGRLFCDAGAGGKRALDKRVADMVANFGYEGIDAWGRYSNGNRTHLHLRSFAAAFLCVYG